MKPFSFGQILKPRELTKAKKLYAKTAPGKFAEIAADQIFAPALRRIQRALGPEMYPLYLGYALEYALNETRAAQANVDFPAVVIGAAGYD